MHRLAGHRTVGARRPRFRVGDERVGARRQRVGGEALVLPAAAERPRFRGGRWRGPILHRLLRPVGRFLDVGRAGEPRTVDVGEVAFDLHHLRALQALVLDRVDRVGIQTIDDRTLGCERKRQRRGDCSQDGETAHSRHRVRTPQREQDDVEHSTAVTHVTTPFAGPFSAICRAHSTEPVRSLRRERLGRSAQSRP